MTTSDCYPGREVQTPYGPGMLLHPVPGTQRKEWLVYADGKAYPVAVAEMREADDAQSRPD